MGFTKAFLASSLLLLGQAAALDPIVMKVSTQNTPAILLQGPAHPRRVLGILSLMLTVGIVAGNQVLL